MVDKRYVEFSNKSKDNKQKNNTSNDNNDSIKKGDKIVRQPLCNSIIYGTETYHYTNSVEYNYNKHELDILLILMKIFYLILMEDKKLSENVTKFSFF